ncbi:MAG: gliding motility-associated C-terminal domain-containing protein [Bacteroidales bacterium]|nr:gliding motility-associated C-terminal domain-containing protein [Bacteroidales bacterium]
MHVLSSIYKHLILVVLIINSSVLIGQVDAGEDITISAGLPLKLTGAYLGYTGIPITAGDDPFVGPFDIEFSFDYFGQAQTQFAVSPNGLVSFDIPDIIGLSHQELTSIPNNIFKKTIMGPYQDLFTRPINPHDDYIYYLTVGDAPNRKLIVGWCEAPMFGCANLKATYQIVLNEETNTIVNHILSKPSCNHLQNKATQGLNFNNDLGVVVTDRNVSSWTSSNESWLFEPDGPENYTITSINFEPEVIVPQGKLEWAWYKNSYPDGEIISTSSSLTIFPTESTTYYAEITTCNGMKYVDEVFVKTIPIPNAFNPNSSVGLNRTFTVFASPLDYISNYKMYIYNRWGQQIFETNSLMEGWDGTINGTPCNPGVYVWVIYYDAGEGEVTNKGIVTLVQ